MYLINKTFNNFYLFFILLFGIYKNQIKALMNIFPLNKFIWTSYNNIFIFKWFISYNKLTIIIYKSFLLSKLIMYKEINAWNTSYNNKINNNDIYYLYAKLIFK